MAIETGGMAPLLQVFDMPRAVAFYRDAFGFALEMQSHPGDTFDWCQLRLGRTVLMLNTAYESHERPPAPDPARVKTHEDTGLFFSCNDLEAAVIHLRSMGIDTPDPIVAPYGMRQVWLHDPDGYEVCLQHPV